MAGGRTLDDLIDEHGVERIRELEQQLAIEKAKVATLSGQANPLQIEDSTKNTIRFGIVSDTHIGSLYARTDALQGFYNYAKERGVKQIYVTGDLIEGHHMYRSQIFEVRDVGFDAQVEALKKEFPSNVKTSFICGNHDLSYQNDVGINVGKAIMAARQDLVHIGDEHGRIQYNTPNGPFMVGLMHPGGGTAYALCFSIDTEILTKRGWVLFNELNHGVPVATLNRDTRELEWQVPTEYVDMAYAGDMLHFNSARCDLLVTPDHRFFARRPWDRCSSSNTNGSRVNIGWQMVRADDINGRDWVIPKSCKWNSGQDPTLPMNADPLSFAELIGWYISEGSRSKANYQIQIDQKDRRVLCEISALISKCGLTCYDRMDIGRLVISNRKFYKWIDQNCPGRSHEKRVPVCFMNATKKFLSAFMRGYLRGDGCMVDGYWHSCTTVSRGLADDIQEICLKLGFSASIKEQDGRTGNIICGREVKTSRTRYQISFNHKMLELVMPAPVRIGYSGRVYCVSVPNEIIMVRRNGKCVWSGNSYKPQNIARDLEGGTKPNLLAIGHYHKAEMLPTYRNMVIVQSATFQAQTPFMAKKPTPAHMGGWLFEIVVGGAGHNIIRTEFVAVY